MAEGHVADTPMAWCGRSAGVGEQGMYVRVTQEPGRARGGVFDRWERRGHHPRYRQAKATKHGGRVDEQSESADRTVERGKPTPGAPREGSGQPILMASGGIDDADFGPRGHLNATTDARKLGGKWPEARIEHAGAPHRPDHLTQYPGNGDHDDSISWWRRLIG
jgi:hypothetical protein